MAAHAQLQPWQLVGGCGAAAWLHGHQLEPAATAIAPLYFPSRSINPSNQLFLQSTTTSSSSSSSHQLALTFLSLLQSL
jgi:hypothetical protein